MLQNEIHDSWPMAAVNGVAILLPGEILNKKKQGHCATPTIGALHGLALSTAIQS
jgi:hypothetical protein